MRCTIWICDVIVKKIIRSTSYVQPFMSVSFIEIVCFRAPNEPLDIDNYILEVLWASFCIDRGVIYYSSKRKLSNTWNFLCNVLSVPFRLCTRQAFIHLIEFSMKILKYSSEVWSRCSSKMDLWTDKWRRIWITLKWNVGFASIS